MHVLHKYFSKIEDNVVKHLEYGFINFVFKL